MPSTFATSTCPCENARHRDICFERHQHDHLAATRLASCGSVACASDGVQLLLSLSLQKGCNLLSYRVAASPETTRAARPWSSESSPTSTTNGNTTQPTVSRWLHRRCRQDKATAQFPLGYPLHYGLRRWHCVFACAAERRATRGSLLSRPSTGRLPGRSACLRNACHSAEDQARPAAPVSGIVGDIVGVSRFGGFCGPPWRADLNSKSGPGWAGNH